MFVASANTFTRGRSMSCTAGLVPTHPASRRTLRRHLLCVPRAGLLDFWTAPATSKASSRTQAAELVDRLLAISLKSDAGLSASPSMRSEIEDLVEELERYCPRSPLRSQRIFGDWEVVYASKPQTAGGPFRSPLGRILFPGQRAIQTIEPPNVCINQVSYKALGFVPGTARQEGEIEPVDENTFKLTFPDLVAKSGRAGGPAQRLIQVAYLDDRIRIARALPANEGEEGSFYVFRRVDEEDGEEEEDDPVVNIKSKSQSQPPRQRASAFGTQVFGNRGGMATQAERAVAARGGRVASPADGPKKREASGTVVRKSREMIVEEKKRAQEAAVAERRRAVEAAAAAKAAAEEQRRKERESAADQRRRAQEAAAQERQRAAEAAARAKAEAEAERAAKVKLRDQAREQYEAFSAEASAQATAAREAAAVVKSAEREAAGLLRAAAQAQGIIDRVMAAAEGATAKLISAEQEEVTVEKAVLEQQRTVNELEKRLRQVTAAMIIKT